MKKLTKEAITQLAHRETQAPAVTIYVPTHRSASPPHMIDDQTRFKNLVSKARQKLRKHGHSGQDLADQLADKQEQLLDDPAFWENQTEGMIVFAADGQVDIFNLPMDTEEYVSVDESFFLAPVLGLADDHQEYFVLSVAQKHPVLFRGDSYGIQTAGVTFPESLTEGLNIDEVNQQTEHSLSAGGSSMHTNAFNGRGGTHNMEGNDRLRFWRMIDEIVCKQDTEGLPLILAGTESETAEYRSASKYPHILQGIINGNHSHDQPKDVFVKAVAIVRRELIDTKRQAALEDYKRVSGANPDRAAQDAGAIETAAEQGRVDKLLVHMTSHTSDTVRDDTQEVDRISFPESKLGKVINSLALKVWKMSGTVVNLTQVQIPGGAPMVARLRY